MRQQARFVSGVLCLILTACTLVGSADVTPQVITASPPPSEHVPLYPPDPSMAAASLVPDTPAGLYTSVVSLLDGVCFEFLYSINGETWVWTSPGDLTAFYNRVDASELCRDPVQREAFNFDDQMLVGVVNACTGCDAAHRFVDLIQDDSAHTLTLVLELDVSPGCPYELVQPFLIAVPRAPEGYTTRVVIKPTHK